MDSLETRGLAAPGSSKVALVASLALLGIVLEDNVGDLEDLHGHTVALVLTDGLEKTGKQRGADNLVLEGLGVGKADDSVTVVLAVEPGKVLVVRAEDEREDFDPAGHGGLDTDNIAELVDGQGTANGGAASGRCAGEVVEAVADGKILHDITLVQNIGARGRDSNVEEVLVGGRGLGNVSHLGEELAEVLGRAVEASAGVEVVDLGGGLAGLENRCDTAEVVVLRDNLDGLDGEGLLAVHGEHGDKHVGDDGELGHVGGGDLDEDVGGVEGDLGVLAVDDGGQRADDAVGIKDDGVHGGVADDVQEAAQVLVGLVKGHELLAGHLLGLVERDELEGLGVERLVGEGAFDGVEVVGTHGHERSVTGKVLVQLVLQTNERVVALLRELDVAEDGTGDEGADLEGFGVDGDDLLLSVLGLDNAVVGGCHAAEEDVEVHGDTFEAQHVVAVGGDFDLELWRLLHAIDNGALILLGVFVELDAVLEAEIFEFVLGVSVTEGRRSAVSMRPVDGGGGVRGGFWGRAA